MKTRGWVLHRGILGLGQNTTPVPCRSCASTSTTALPCAFELIANLSSNQGQPVGVLGVAAVDDVKVRTLDLLGDGATAAFTDLQAVELTDGGHFSGGASEEGLVRDVD